MDDHVVGVLGGGQLGRMLVEAAHRLNIKVAVLDAENAPAKQTNALTSHLHVTGSFASGTDIRKLAANCDILTVEIEHVDTKALEELDEEQPSVRDSPVPWSHIQPSWSTIRVIQDKFAQKQHLAQFGIPTAPCIAVGTSHPQGLKEIADRLGYPVMLKSRTNAYDGRGNCKLASVADIEPALQTLHGRPLYAEGWADFAMELAVMVVKFDPRPSVVTAHGQSSPLPEHGWASTTLAYPVVETVHEDSICKLVYAPARNVPKTVQEQAEDIARRAVSTFWGCGVFGVELFLLKDGTILVNEIAPRPHNSGHYTIEACHMSQYEAHLRAILPRLATTITPGCTEFVTNNTNAIMLNILGGAAPDSHLLVARAAMKVPGAKVHLYGKGGGRPGRKMGHITILGSTMSECETKMHPLIHWVDAVRKHRTTTTDPAEAIISTARDSIFSTAPPKPGPIIAVIMGSDTDLATLRPGLTLLEELGVPYEVNITSAHRTPQYMLDYGRAAAGRGLRVIIAAAGGAAHLPGMVASVTPLPVIGCPVKASSLDGLDSLLSIVQMPRGIPVATVSIGNSVNAALLAARIVGVSDTKVRAWVENHLQKMDDENMAKGARLREGGWQDYRKLDA